jgi:hypothetical protein
MPPEACVPDDPASARARCVVTSQTPASLAFEMIEPQLVRQLLGVPFDPPAQLTQRPGNFRMK